MTDSDESRGDGQRGARNDANGFLGRLRKDFAAQQGSVKIIISVVSTVSAALILAGIGWMSGLFSDDASDTVTLVETTDADGVTGDTESTSTTTTSTTSSTTTTTEPPQEEPFTVAVQKRFGDAWQVWLDEDMPPIENWPPYNDLVDYRPQLFEPLGVAHNPSWLLLTIEGTASQTATITGARAQPQDCDAPQHAASFNVPADGETESIGWHFEVDQVDTEAYELLGDDYRGEPYFEGRQITVAPGEVVNIEAQAFARELDCTWTLELDVVFDAETITMTVDNDGDPFRASPGNPDSATNYSWWYFDNQVWVFDGARTEPPVEVWQWNGDAYVPGELQVNIWSGGS